MKNILLLIGLLSSTFLSAQFDSNFMEMLGRWDNDDLVETSSGNAYSDIWGYAADGREYAIIGSRAFVHFIDVTDPENPVLINEFLGGVETTWRDMKTYGEHAYAVSDASSEGMLVFDLSDLPNTVEMVHIDSVAFLSSHNIYIDEDNARLYSVGNGVADLLIFDLEDNPAVPELIASISLPGEYIHDIYVRDNIAYASHLGNGFYVYDLTDPQNPVTLGTLTDYPGEVFNHSSWLSEDGNTVVFCDEKHDSPVKALDVSDFTDMQVSESNLFKSTLEAPSATNSIAHNVFIKDNLAYISYYHEGVQVYDISDINNVVRVGYFDTFENTEYQSYYGCWGVYPFLPSGNIIASDRTNGLFILQMSTVSDVNETIDEAVENFTIYPNPAEDELNIIHDFDDQDLLINIYTVDGKLVFNQKQKQFNTSSFQLNISHFDTGIYMLEINGTSKEFYKK